MDQPTVTTRQLRARFVAASTVIVVIVAGATVGSIAGGAAKAPAKLYSAVSAYPPSQTVTPTPAEQRATLLATDEYRRQVVTATELFATATAALQFALRQRDLSAAKSSEQAAQAAFDVFRPDIESGLAAGTPLDALVENQPSGAAPTGLHAIERDLWNGNMGAATALARSLNADDVGLEVALSRTILTPAVIAARLEESLSWVVEEVIDVPQEQFSHDDLLDVRATIISVTQSIAALRPLGLLVSRAATGSLSRATIQLSALLAPLQASTPDRDVPAATWRSLAESIDAVIGPLGVVSGSFYGFGTGRTYA